MAGLCVSVSIMAVACSLAAAPPAPRAYPSFQGVQLPIWVRFALDDDPTKRMAAREALFAMSSWDLTHEARELLLPTLRSKNPLIVRRTREALDLLEIGPWSRTKRDRWVAHLRSDDPARRYLGAYWLYLVGPAAAPGAAALEKLLKDADVGTRRQAALTLANCGPRGKAAVPVLLDILRDEKVPIDHIFAAIALGRIGPDAAAGVPLLIRMLKAESDAARSKAALALGRIGRKAAKAEGPLRAALRDKDADVRTCAAVALWYVSQESKLSVPVLRAALKVERVQDLNEIDSWLLRHVVRTLADMGPVAKDAIPELVSLKRYEQFGLRWCAGVALRSIRGPKSPP